MVSLQWAGAVDAQEHRVAIEAEPGTAGSRLAREICSFLGTEAELTVENVDVRSLRFAEPPLLDGAAITLHPSAPAPPTSHHTASTQSAADQHMPSPRLRVVAGVACGTELVIMRGSQWLESVAGVPALAAHPATSDSTEVVMDHAEVRIMSGPVPLREGDRLRCQDSWLQLIMPSDDTSTRRRVSWPTASANDDSPARIITVHRASGQGPRLGLVMGLFPLVLGVVITVVTGMWFFMLFSAVGAIVAVTSWSVGRAVRTRERARLTAALARDLSRCREAAPSAADVVHRLQKLDAGASMAQPGHSTMPGPHERWVRLGEAGRVATVQLGDGPSAAPASHRLAPVLLDMSRVPHLELTLPSRHRADVINSLALQLLTGPGALQQLILDPVVGWSPPPFPALRVVEVQHHRSVTGPALEVYSARSATAIPSAEGRVRIVISVAGDRTEGDSSGAVLSWDATATLACDVEEAVPGLDASTGSNRLELSVDTVSSAVFGRSMQQWSRAQAAIPSLRHAAGLPSSLGSEPVLPEPSKIPEQWAANARLPSLVAAIGVSHHGVESLALGDEHPHLLIAGTTGCGKSEVLRTLVAALACRYPPDRLEFLLVDFKGGAALAPLTGLPQRSTLLTDLAAADVQRALEFLRSERRRRERLLAQHGLSDFHQLLHTTPDTEPLVSRELVVVVDEVKMLVDAFSSAGDELAKIATVGRSLGIHLVLATQRPQGAIPADVRANVTQSMCLRVRTEQDSADVIGTSLAAGISSTTPGRAFIDTGQGKPVEVQTAILTGCSTPPVDEVRIRLPETAPSARLPRGAGQGHTVDSGVLRVVADIAAAHRCLVGPEVECSDNTNGSSRDNPIARPVPAPLPETAVPRASSGDEVDLGPAENSAEHWTGRAAWRPLEDGTLFLIGQPMHTSRALLSVAEQLIRARSRPDSCSGRAPALYVMTATPALQDPARRWSDLGWVHGTAAAYDAADVKSLLDSLSDGSQRYLSHSSDGRGDPPEPAVLLVEDWDRCCALLRSGPWAHLEDDLLALASAGTQNGVAMIVSGDRSLAVGRASSAGRTRVYFPAEQTPEALLQWPRLPAVKPLPLRGVLQGASAERCSPAPAHRSPGAHTVIQFPEPSGIVVHDDKLLPGKVPGEPMSTGRGPSVHPPMSDNVSASAPDTIIWPRYRPLPERWSGPEGRVPGLLVGLGTGHVPMSTPWTPGSTLLVVGPSRSGRSTFLDSVEESLGTRTVLRCHPTSAEDLERKFSGAATGTTLLIDDADSLGAQVIQRLGSLWQSGGGMCGAGEPKDLRLIVTMRLSDGLPGLFPPLMQWRHVADTLLLRPRKTFDGELFGASLAGMPVGGPPGRGYWIHRGVADLVQTPQRDG